MCEDTKFPMGYDLQTTIMDLRLTFLLQATIFMLFKKGGGLITGISDQFS